MSEIHEFTLQFICPNTQRLLTTAAKGDAAYIAERWRTALRVDCPHCKKQHDFFFKEGFISGSVDMTLGELHFATARFG